jgi:hypothetical protein
MTYFFRLQRTDGSPADPPTYVSTVLSWRQGDTIPLGAEKTCASANRRRLESARSVLERSWVGVFLVGQIACTRPAATTGRGRFQTPVRPSRPRFDPGQKGL